MIAWLDQSLRFPPLNTALREPNGLLAAGGDLSRSRLLAAYHLGIFPWTMPGEPLLWWSPDPRMVLKPADLHVPVSLGKVLRNKPYRIAFDTQFEAVMRGCAAPRKDTDQTWISEEMIAAYVDLHTAGYAHSAECYIDNDLVGGLYGVALGNMFYGESMFARRPDASKLAFVHLVHALKEQGFGLIDCQMHTEHLARFGAAEVPRALFTAALSQLVRQERQPGLWHYNYQNPGN